MRKHTRLRTRTRPSDWWVATLNPKAAPAHGDRAASRKSVRGASGCAPISVAPRRRRSAHRTHTVVCAFQHGSSGGPAALQPTRRNERSLSTATRFGPRTPLESGTRPVQNTQAPRGSNDGGRTPKCLPRLVRHSVSTIHLASTYGVRVGDQVSTRWPTLSEPGNGMRGPCPGEALDDRAREPSPKPWPQGPRLTGAAYPV